MNLVYSDKEDIVPLTEKLSIDSNKQPSQGNRNVNVTFNRLRKVTGDVFNFYSIGPRVKNKA